MSTRYDIAVVGGGTSGSIAALTAARKGARVVLIEASNHLGGVATQGLHRFVGGLFPIDHSSPGPFLHGEAVFDFCSGLAQGDPVQKAVRRGRVWLLPFAGGNALEAYVNDRISKENKIQVIRRDRLVRAICREGFLVGLSLASGQVLDVAAAVDATGSAALCCLAGGGVTQPSSPQLSGYGFEVSDVNEQLAGNLGLHIEVPLALRRAVETEGLPRYLSFTTWEPGDISGTGWIKIAVSGTSLKEAKSKAEWVWRILVRTPAFRQARIVRDLPRVLPREVCHLRGEYELTGEDIREARKFPDGVVQNAWPVEYWDACRGATYAYPVSCKPHDIPLRCLRAQEGPQNIFCAGASISADSEASASLRIMGVCMALGEAAAAQCINLIR